MNLELIRKYEKEFLHMLHGGNLLSRVMTSDKDDEMYTIWYKVNACNNMEKWSSEHLFNLTKKEYAYYKPQFVIDDEYVEFRKALAEGKTVQYRTKHSNWIDYKDNNGINCNIFSSNKSVASCYEYRIKPEEPKFKVGDWVHYIHDNNKKALCIDKFIDERYHFSNSSLMLREDEIEKWEPKEGEPCIFWNNSSHSAVIAIFIYKSNWYYITKNNGYSNCMPFTGVLPPHMKESL